MYVHLRGEGAERGEGCSQGLGNLMLLFYHGWWSIWGNLLCDFTTKHLKRGDRDSSWEMAPAQLCAKLTKKHEDEHLPLQLPVFIQRDVLGGVDQGPQAVCTHSGFSRSNQHALVSAENFPIWLYWWMLYNQLHFDTYQCENNSGTKAAGIPQSQQPNSEHHKRGNKVVYEIICPFSKLHLNWDYKALQGWERWVLLPEMSLGLEGGKREDHAPYSASKVCFNYTTR